MGIGNDVTEQQRREAILEGMLTAARELMHGHVDRNIATAATGIARETFSPLSTAVYVFEEDAGQLARSSVATDLDDPPCPERVASGEHPVWTAFVEERAVRVDGTVADGASVERFAIPLGDHGVCCFAFAKPVPLEGVLEDFVQIFATTVQAAFDRASRERTLREQDERLTEQNERLEQLNPLNAMLRNVVGSLVSADGVEDVGQAVRRELAERPSYRFAWIGEYDAIDETITPDVWSGVTADYVDHLTANVLGAADENPFCEAIDTGEVQVVSRAMTSDAWSGIRQESLSYDYQSLAAVPLVTENRTVGVLAIHASDPDAFREEEQTVLQNSGASSRRPFWGKSGRGRFSRTRPPTSSSPSRATNSSTPISPGRSTAPSGTTR